jgi:GT2 family glycosyltransferase
MPPQNASGSAPETGLLISVVVPHYNDLAGLRLLLDSLDRQTFPRERYELVVADNQSPQGLAAVQEVVGERGRVISVAEKGAGPARNAGATETRAPYLAFIDADCVADPEWLERGLQALQSHPEPHVLGGRVEVTWDKSVPHTPAQCFEKVFAFDNRSYVEKKGFTVTANLMCAKQVFDRVGPFRNGVSEDVDWCLRAKSLGYQVRYADDVVVFHPPRQDFRQLFHKWRRLTAEMLQLDAERPGWRARWAVKAALLPVSIPIGLPAAVLNRNLTVSDKAKAVIGLTVIRAWRSGHIIGLLLKGHRPSADAHRSKAA